MRSRRFCWLEAALWVISAICVVCGLAGIVNGAEPVIDVPAEVEQYDGIHAVANVDGVGYLWWVIGPRGFETVYPTGPNNASIVFMGPPGSYRIMLGVGLENGSWRQGQATVVRGGTTPPDPTPNPDPEPNPGELSSIVIVLESSELVSNPARAPVFLDRGWRKYLKEKSIVWERVDPDAIDPTENVPSRLASVLLAAKATEGPDVCFVGEDGKVTCNPFPATAVKMLALLKKWGGE